MRALRYDGHVHLVGNGLGGSGCWLRLDGMWHRLLGEVMRRTIGLEAKATSPEFDQSFVRHLVGLLAGSSLDAALLLAQDEVYDEEGRKLDFGSFYVPNEYLFRVCARHPVFVPAVSIHPGRKDALEELERCLAAGARALKLLPNCQNVDCSSPRYEEFWRRMAAAELPFLCHTGGEMTVPVINRAYQDPRILRRPLELGVKVIAAHCAGNSHFFDPNYFGELVTLMDEFPRLYADTSALNSPIRSGVLRQVRESGRLGRFLHGSDFPVPVGALWARLRGLISTAQWRDAGRIANLIERDAYLKRAMGFDDAHFTRLHEVLRPI
ncbi:MAG: amidohydrolase family protein [Verrucomicrobiota bacterium]